MKRGSTIGKSAATIAGGGGVGKCAGRLRREDRSLGVGAEGVDVAGSSGVGELGNYAPVTVIPVTVILGVIVTFTVILVILG